LRPFSHLSTQRADRQVMLAACRLGPFLGQLYGEDHERGDLAP
jgi:hypothetical protein